MQEASLASSLGRDELKRTLKAGWKDFWDNFNFEDAAAEVRNYWCQNTILGSTTIFISAGMTSQN